MFHKRLPQEKATSSSADTMPSTHFSLPLVEALNPSAPKWILDKSAWKIAEESQKAFQQARDGQGFTGIVFIEKEEKTQQPIARIRLFPTYNAIDGLAKEDKSGTPYSAKECIHSPIDFGVSGAGIIHNSAVALDIIKKNLADSSSKLSKAVIVTSKAEDSRYDQKSEPEKKQSIDSTVEKYLKEEKLQNNIHIKEPIQQARGYTLGFSLIKGAESQDEKEYQVDFIEDEEMTKKLYQAFTQRKTEPLAEFKKNKKHFVLVKDRKNTNPNAFHVYYIQNQKLVRSPSRTKEISAPVISIEKTATPTKKEIIALALKAMNLNQSIIINNKSASQNNGSINYNFNFESHIMYADEKKYNVENEHLSTAIHAPNSMYDIRRSIPPAIMKLLCHTLLPAIKIESVEKEIKINQAQWSSWSNPPYSDYDHVIDHFYKATPQEKINIISDNIDTTLLLYYKKIKDVYITHREKLIGNELAYLDASYLNNLELRLQHLLISYQDISQGQKKFVLKDDHPLNDLYMKAKEAEIKKNPRPLFEEGIKKFRKELIDLRNKYASIQPSNERVTSIAPLRWPMYYCQLNGQHTKYAEFKARWDKEERFVEEKFLLKDELSLLDNSILMLGMDSHKQALFENPTITSFEYPTYEPTYKPPEYLSLIENINKIIEHPEKIKDQFINKAIESAKKLCSAEKKSDLISNFLPTGKNLFNSLKCAYANEEKMKFELKSLLQLADSETGMTALENVVQKGWYDMVELLVYHGADMNKTNEKTKQTVFDIFIKKISQEEPENIKTLARTVLKNILSMREVINPDTINKITTNPLFPISQEELQKKAPSINKRKLHPY